MDILTYNIHGLPWSRDHTEGIATFLLEKLPSIICLQEVFLDRNRNFYKEFLELLGYTVCLPRDSDVTLLPSGLVTAFKRSEFAFISDCFCPYQDTHNVEWFANKGFHILRLIHRRTQKRIRVVNTHTQSDTEISWIFGRAITAWIRGKQAEQIYNFFKGTTEQVLIIGDLNCESEPFHGLRFLHPPGSKPLKKRTFYSTGEDLDHLACLTDRPEPRVHRCRIYDRPWSDHAPVHFYLDL